MGAGGGPCRNRLAAARQARAGNHLNYQGRGGRPLQFLSILNVVVLTGAERAEPCLPLPAGAYLLGVMPPELLQLLELDLPLRRRSPHYFLPTTSDKCVSAELQQLQMLVHTLLAASLRGLWGGGCHLKDPALLFSCLPCVLHCQYWRSPCEVGAPAVLLAHANPRLQVPAAGRGRRGQQAPVPALLLAGAQKCGASVAATAAAGAAAAPAAAAAAAATLQTTLPA